MTTIQDLRTQRASIWEQMKATNDRAETEKRDLTVEEQTAWDQLDKDLDRLTASIDRQEKFAQRGKDLESVDRSGLHVTDRTDGSTDADHDAAYKAAFRTYVTQGMGELTNEQRGLLRANFQGGDVRNAAGVGSGSSGGYLVPQEYRKDLVETMKAFGGVQQVAQVIETTTGAVLPWPTNDDTGNVGALLAENTASAEQDFVFGTAQLGAYKYTSKLVRISIEFLQDVDWIDTQAFVGRKFSERLGRIHNQHFTTGTGSSQPQGIVTGATSGVTAASATAITADELIDLQHSVDPAYRNGRDKFMFRDSTLKILRKLKATGTGEYLFQVSTSADVPNLLAGAPYVINQDMPAATTGLKSVLYGDFYAGYVIRLVKAFELIRLNERYAEYGQVGFIGFDRADGLVQDANAFRALTQA